MASITVALVSRDSEARLAIARAFDAAPQQWDVSLHLDPPAGADVIVWGSDLQAEAPDGAIVFDGEPESTVARVKARTARDVSRLYVLTGAGRGVGVTAVAAHLARAASLRFDTCAVDLDGWRGLSDWFSLDPGNSLTWKDIDDSPESARRAAHPVEGGFRLLVGPASGDAEVEDVLDRVLGEFDRVVVDCPWGDGVGRACRNGRAGVMIVPYSAAGAGRAAALLESEADFPWAIALNRLGPGGETTKLSLQREMGRRAAVEFPCTPALRDAADEGRLLMAPWSRFTRRVESLFKALEGVGP